MSAYRLVLNAGSSSLKFSVYRRNGPGDWHLDARGRLNVGRTPTLEVLDGAGRTPSGKDTDPVARDVKAALGVLARWLLARSGGAKEVRGVGHRVVHGGAAYDQPCIVTPKVMEDLRALVPLDPLHQPRHLEAIEAVAEHLPGVPQVACFDTSFHRCLPSVATLIPLPQAIREAGVQRYGFHGISYEYIASVLPDVAPEIAEGRVIVAHLGNGASLCAMKARASVECTFGFSTLDGLCMGTRPGSLDPGVILHLLQVLKLSAGEVEKLLYEESGLLGLSATSNDMRDLVDHPDPRARLAVDYFVYQATKQVGALAAVLGGVDALVFTAGIGENSAVIRRRICEACAWLSVSVDERANDRHGPRITRADSRVSAWVIPTNEELMIARHTEGLLGDSAGG